MFSCGKAKWGSECLEYSEQEPVFLLLKREKDSQPQKSQNHISLNVLSGTDTLTLAAASLLFLCCLLPSAAIILNTLPNFQDSKERTFTRLSYFPISRKELKNSRNTVCVSQPLTQCLQKDKLKDVKACPLYS